MSSLGGLGTALSGLEAQQRAMGVISQNITNVDTPGYSRETVQLKAASLPPGAQIYTKAGVDAQGVSVDSVTRVRDQFLDTSARSALANQGSADQSATLLGKIEDIVPEPSDTGLSNALSQFWSSWADATNNPSSTASRTAVLTQGAAVATQLNSASNAMVNLRSNVVTQISLSVNQINGQTAQIAALNRQIRTAIAGGSDPSAMQDTRDNLIDGLATSVGATTHANSDGTVDVFLGGGTLVREDSSSNLAVTQSGTLTPPLDTLPMSNVAITWVDGKDAVQGLGGQLGAAVTAADNTIPRYLSQLDGVASALVTSVNSLHQSGQGLDATNDVNLSFFDPTKLTAGTVALSSDVAGQPSRIALAAAGGGTLDASIGQQIASLAGSASGPDANFQTMVGALGVEVQSANDRSTTQDQVAASAQSARTSVSGVNLDEEMTNLIAAQRAYESSARLMTTIDSMLDTLINHTGVT